MNRCARATRYAHASRVATLAIAAMITLNCSAHDQLVHMAITLSAARSSDGLSSFLTQALGVQDAPFIESPLLNFDNPEVPFAASPINWVREGANHEDDAPRYANHFYTVSAEPPFLPGAAKGLTDATETLGAGFLGTTNSFVWASVPGKKGPWPPGKPNIYGWRNAREHQFAALTENLVESRNSELAAMLYCLGHVLHLNEDLSQPDHTRNDEHVPFRHPWIEDYGRDTYLSNAGSGGAAHFYDFFPLRPRGWTNWQSKGFSKLLDFWDRGLYRGSAYALDQDARGEQELGLAEFSNGNFLGEDSTYTEFFSKHSLHYFPHPSLRDTDQPQIKPGSVSRLLVDTVTLENGRQGNGIYLAKIASGIQVQHHSALHYLAVLHPPKSDLPSMHVGLRINDPNVLEDYHSILIPKAIEYSAGILDYFFRGKLDVSVEWDQSGSTYKIYVVNKSGQKLYGGGFTLFREDSNGDRTPVTLGSFSYSSSTGLADGSCASGTLSGAPASPTKYVLVFQGKIGVDSNNQALDPVDDDIAVAVKTFYLYPANAQLDDGFRVRIQNFSEVLAAIPVCANCTAATTQPAWDGTFPNTIFVPSVSYRANVGPSQQINLFSIHGKLMLDAWIFCGSPSAGYGIFISCKDSANVTKYIWQGRKIYGSDPTGIYTRAGFNEAVCDHGTCAEDLEQITIEAY